MESTGNSRNGSSERDNKIRAGVIEHLGWNPYVKSEHIRVRVEDGVVILEGDVDSAEMRRMAEDAASSVSGVVRIENRLATRDESHAA